MEDTLLNHIKEHKLLFETWVNDQAVINIGQGQIQPLIVPFQKRFPEVNLNGSCNSCILDMLMWALDKIKEKKVKK